MEAEGGTAIGLEVNTASRQVHFEVVPETQPLPLNGKGMKYKEILASIGLDSPTSSHDTRGNERGEENGLQRGNTPIRSSAASLMALNNYMFSPRQGSLWEGRNKPPLGG